jgi:thiosulfate/3-mercaptopyruvate sulfurtransferase
MYSTLITAAELAAHAADPAWVIFDCRHDLADAGAGAWAYAEGHLPSTRFAHLDNNLSGEKTGKNGRHPLPRREAFVAWLRSQGVNDNSQVVAYDAQGGMFAARLWWMLRWVGHEAVCVLDGGIGAWQQAGSALTQAASVMTPGNIADRAGANPVSADYVEVHLGDPAWRLIDARSPDRYRGENETLDPVGGHIPGALNRFFKDNLAADGRFKPAEQLRTEFTAVLGDVPARDAVHQCGSGVTAAHNLLAMEVAGLSGSRLYPGSWSEWCAEPGRPVASG